MESKKPIKTVNKKKVTPNRVAVPKDTIQEYARTLYLKLDTKGEKKHTNEDIRGILFEKFKKDISLTTIKRWCKEWKDDFVQIRTRALEKVKEKEKEREEFKDLNYANLKEEADIDIDKELIDNQAENLAIIFYNAKQRKMLCHEILIKRLLCQSTIEFEGNEYNIDIAAPYPAIVKTIESSEATMLKLLDSKKEQGLLQAFLGTLPDDVLHKLMKNIGK